MCEDLCITCIMKEHERDIHQQFCTRAYKTSVLIMAFERTHILYAQKELCCSKTTSDMQGTFIVSYYDSNS